MNVVLQTLVHNPVIRDYFLEDSHNRNQVALNAVFGGFAPSLSNTFLW
jgi:hypothetical protein